MKNALRRSEGGRGGVLDDRNKEWGSWFSQFAADLLKIANSGSANGGDVLEFATGFARNGTLSNGNSGNPSHTKGFPGF